MIEYQDDLMKVQIEIDPDGLGSENPDLEDFINSVLALASSAANMYSLSPGIFEKTVAWFDMVGALIAREANRSDLEEPDELGGLN